MFMYELGIFCPMPSGVTAMVVYEWIVGILDDKPFYSTPAEPSICDWLQ